MARQKVKTTTTTKAKLRKSQLSKDKYGRKRCKTCQRYI